MAIAVEIRPTAGPVAAEQPRERAGPLPALTGVRFLAALWVVGVHCFSITLPPGTIHDVVASGGLAVSLFFVLSGFVLAYSYTDTEGRLRGSRRDFYVARIARLAPLYLLGLALGIGPALMVQSPPYLQANPIAVTLLTLTATQAWVPYLHYVWDGPAWSLSVEVVFYLLFPALVEALAPLRRRGLWCGIVACYVAVFLPSLFYEALRPDRLSTAPLGYWAELVLYNPLVHLPEFLMGVLIGRLFILGRARGRRLDWLSGPAALLAVTLILRLVALPPSMPGDGMAPGWLAPVFGLLIWALACGRGPLAWLLSRPLLLLLGEASYGLYLLHVPLWQWLQVPWGRPVFWYNAGLPYALGFAVLATCVSVVTYRLVECPARRWLRHHL
jgi:peptidoglycan/LPS O-acetylase OafA/YrhL